jgi:cell shape-determining protein MreC
VSEKPKMARSYRGAVVDDNAIISINIKWLLQSAVVIAGLVYSYYSVIQRITELEKGMLDANNTITELVEKHILEEQERFAEMEEELKWYEKALGKKKKK